MSEQHIPECQGTRVILRLITFFQYQESVCHCALSVLALKCLAHPPVVVGAGEGGSKKPTSDTEFQPSSACVLMTAPTLALFSNGCLLLPLTNSSLQHAATCVLPPLLIWVFIRHLPWSYVVLDIRQGLDSNCSHLSNYCCAKSTWMRFLPLRSLQSKGRAVRKSND